MSILTEDVDPELLVMALLDDVGYTDTAIPDYQDYIEAESADGGYFAGWDDILPIVVVNALPAGGVTSDGLQHRALISVICIGRDRGEAKRASDHATRLILNHGDPQYVTYEDGGDEYGPYLVEPTQMVEPPTLEPDVDPDNRFREAHFWIPISLRF